MGSLVACVGFTRSWLADYPSQSNRHSIGVEERLREVRIQPMTRKWASVSTRGRLTLSRDLLDQPAAFRRKVIVHELVHLKLRHGGHTKLFRALVQAYLAEGDSTAE